MLVATITKVPSEMTGIIFHEWTAHFLLPTMLRRVKPIIIFCAVLLSFLLTYSSNRLALRPWRKAAGRHWSEHARLLFPVRRAAAANVWVLPAVLSLGAWLALPEKSPHWSLVMLSSLAGCIAGTLPLDRAMFPRIPMRELLRHCAVSWIAQFLTWGVFITATTLMPDVFDSRAALITLAVLLLLFFWSKSGALGLYRLFGLCSPAPERLMRIVRDTAGKMGAGYRDVWLLRSPFANAFAVPASGRLLFSERLLDVLGDAEISAICAHELAHLTEKRSDYLLRYLAWLTFLPWIFLHPLLHRFDEGGFFLLMALTILVPKALRGLSQKLEKRADGIAQAHETEPGVYAGALARIYEDGLLPAVNSRKTASHPDLYDRMEAAGITPDFPRPARPVNMAWHGRIFAGALGFVAMLSILKYLHKL